jgi:hypothetical protein
MDKTSARNSIIQIIRKSYAHGPKIDKTIYKSITEDRETKSKQIFSLLTKIDQMAIDSSKKRFDTWECSRAS